MNDHLAHRCAHDGADEPMNAATTHPKHMLQVNQICFEHHPYLMPSNILRKRSNTLIAVAIAAIALSCSIGLMYLNDHLSDLEDKEELERMVEEYRANKFATYETENELYDDYEVDVAFLGDSLTDGCDLQRYYPEFLTSNRGIGGDTTIGLEARLGISVYDLKPKVAVVLIGANNFDSMLDNYEDIIIEMRENLPHTEIVICSLTSMGGDHWAKNNQLAAYNNVTIHKLAMKHGCEFVDLYTPLFNETTGENHEEYTTDGGHLTHEGYLVVSGEIKPVIAGLLDDWTLTS